MNGRLTGGAKCCLKGCENDAGARKFDSLIGKYEIKCSPQYLIGDMENVKNLRVCDKHYASLASRDHKPAKGKSSSKSRSDAQLVCLSSDVPFNKHNINVFKTCLQYHATF